MTALQTEYRGRNGFRVRLGTFLAVIISVALLLGTSLQIGLGAANLLNTTPVEGKTQVRGYLANRQEFHYLGLHVSERFTTVQLGLSVEPLGMSRHLPAAQPSTDPDAQESVQAVDLSVADTVNFLVLTELGLQRFLAGEDPWEVNLAAGTLTDKTDPAGADGVLRFEAEFRSIGRGGYTVLVYNSSDTPATYRLEVSGGTLIDGAGQTVPARQLQSDLSGRLETIATNPVPLSAPTLASLPVSALGRPSPLPARAESLSGKLNTSSQRQSPQRHYYVLEPATNADELTISLAYTLPRLDPTQAAELQSLHNGVNYWIFTEAGVRQLDQGAPAEFLSLASGMPFLGVPNLLRTRVRLTGETAYVVVVYNETGHDLDYRVRVTGGKLVDLYEQSHEAQHELHESVGETLTLIVPEADEPRVLPKALEVIPPPDTEETPSTAGNESASEITEDSVGENSAAPPAAQPEAEEKLDEEESAPARYRLPLFHVEHFENLAESLRQKATPHIAATQLAAGESARWTVAPDSAFARVVITLEADDSIQFGTDAANVALQDVRIWVVSKEGLRRVEAGMHPSQATVTGFTVLRLGQNQGILQASFDAVGYEPYTVIMENGSDAPLQFELNVRNGLFHLLSAAGEPGLQ